MRGALAGLLSICGCASATIPSLVPSQDREIPVSCRSRDDVALGWDAMDEGNRGEAQRLFERATRRDPSCAVALAHRGVLTPGDDGEALLKRARAEARSLAPAERLQIEILVAVRAGEAKTALELQHKLAEGFPRSWRAQYLLGRRLSAFQRYDEAATALVRASELAPDEPAPFEVLAWVRLEGQERPHDALDPIERWIALEPDDAAGHELHGAALALLGRLVEAESALLRSSELEPDPRVWERIAWVRGLKGDDAAMLAALEEWGRLGTRDDRVRSGAYASWRLLWRGQDAEALSAMRDAEQLAQTPSFLQIASRVARGTMLSLLDRHEEALQVLSEADAMQTAVILPNDDCGESLQWMWMRAQIRSQARMGRLDLVAKSRTRISDLPIGRYADPLRQFASAEVRRAEGDLAAADALYRECFVSDPWCAAERIALAKGRSDSKTVSEMQRSLQANVHPDPLYLYFRAMNRP